MPDTAPRQLADAPVVFVLAAMRFEPLDSLPAWMAEIQESLREQMPVYRRIRQGVTAQGFELAIDPQDFDPNHSGASWVMSSVDSQASIVLSKSALIVHTRQYSTFRDFADLVRIALESLLKHAKRIHVSQVGVRYIDHLRVIKGLGVNELVPRELLPHVPDIEGIAMKTAASTTTYECGGHQLNVRFSTGVGVAVVPDDLMPLYLSSSRPGPAGMVNFQAMAQDEGVLDTDCIEFHATPQLMDEARILNLLDQLHTTANRFFRAVATPEATKAWNGAIQEAR